ncbi:MAG TPA: hypothetical protein VK571_11015 [Gemmatimonadaceae bacterium]|nr:hypothetical protein [Gemmatimonadaceae bacterium]
MASPVRCLPGIDIADYHPLDADEAYSVLEPYFNAVRDDYLKAGLKLVKRVRLFVAPAMHDSARHFGACKDDGSLILLAPELADVADTVMLAIMAHEFGHAVDFLYPGEFVLDHGGPAARRPKAQIEEKQWSKWLKAWHQRDDDVVELTADAIAERVMGVPYGYQGPCLIQSFDATRARPMGLR